MKPGFYSLLGKKCKGNFALTPREEESWEIESKSPIFLAAEKAGRKVVAMTGIEYGHGYHVIVHGYLVS